MLLQKPMLGVDLDWSNPLNDGLKLHLALNERHGDKVRDLSLYGNHGTLKNMAFPPTVDSGWNPGQNGTTLKFDGTGDYVDCGGNASLQTSVFTYSARIKPTDLTGDKSLIAGSALGGAPYLELLNGTIRLLKQNTAVIGSSTRPVSNNVQSTVTATYDVLGNYNLYINGEPAGSGTNLQTFDFASMWIGGKGWWVDPPLDVFNGAVDSVRVHNRVLSAREVVEWSINPYGVYL